MTTRYKRCSLVIMSDLRGGHIGISMVVVPEDENAWGNAKFLCVFESKHETWDGHLTDLQPDDRHLLDPEEWTG